jgi:hypothetical protein
MPINGLEVGLTELLEIGKRKGFEKRFSWTPHKLSMALLWICYGSAIDQG